MVLDPVVILGFGTGFANSCSLAWAASGLGPRIAIGHFPLWCSCCEITISAFKVETANSCYKQSFQVRDDSLKK